MRYAPRIVRRLGELAACTDDPAGITRLYLSPAHAQAAGLVADWMRAAGMTVRRSALGDVIGRYAGATPDAPALLLGSHIDSVPNAGRFDGTLGVVVAIEVVAALAAAGQRLPFAIDVIAFGDEEGSRFTSTLTGSRALAGRFDPIVLEERDRAGVSRRDALVAFGGDPDAVPAEARYPDQTLGYLEVHIEQGPVLEARELPVAIVEAIAGASRGTITLIGEAGHAGTVPMDLRRDALAAAAEIVLAVERCARRVPGLVATVGRCEVARAATNTVPGDVLLSLDVRSADDAIRARALAEIEAEVAAIAGARGVAAAVAMTYEAPAATADRRLCAALAAALTAAGQPVLWMTSGAGHDAMAFGGRIPFAMLFVRCRRGVSHHPDEHAEATDIEVAAEVLWRTLSTLQA
jgi:allantoate deiminase